ncbi:MAG: two-component system response regulator [Gammaproteobacteria bacterium]|nr:MAG: two-component system response regulator [Gammaproteobacteria bacterium]
MKRLLFVDDEADILRGLKRMLHPYRKEWEVVMVSSGAEALEALEKQHFDCIVSDMRMPGMSGAELLSRVAERFPSVARFVLSGHADSGPIMQAVPVTHQYLSKPCSAKHLINVVRRALALHDLVGDETLQAIIGGTAELPNRPEVYSKLTQLLADDDVSLRDVAAVIEQDVGLSAKILKVVNSAFFGLAQQMTRVQDAVGYLGINTVKGLVLGEETFRAFQPPRVPGFSLDEEYRLSMRVARLAQDVLRGEKEQSEHAFIAGLLHRAGRLLLAQKLPDKLAEAIRLQAETDCDRPRAEREVFGVDSGRVGAYLLGLWGLPYPVVEAVANQYAPWDVPHDSFQAVDALYTARALVEEAAATPGRTPLDTNHLQRLGVADRLEAWRERCAELQEAGEA